MAIIQVWSAPSCQSGAICFGSLTPWLSAAGSEAQGTAPSFRITVQRSVADDASLSEGRCLRVLSESRGEQWWFVTSVTHDDGGSGLVTATAGSLRQLLAVRGLVRSGSTFSFTAGAQTATALINAYVLTNLSDDSLSWLSVGTVEWVDAVEIEALDRASRGVVLDRIEQATGYAVRLRALYTGTTLTGFAIDVLADPASALETVPLASGAHISTLTRTRDALRASTVAIPFSASGAAIEMTQWLIDSISGSAPAWLVLRDPVTGNPWPIREDDQLLGAYVEERTGTQTLIADSRASDSAVQVASVGTMVAGDVVRVVRNTAGEPVYEVTSPEGLASARGRLVATVQTQVSDVRRPLALNGALTAWSTATSLDRVTASSSGGIPAVAQYARTEAGGTSNPMFQLDGAVGSGVSTLNLKGGTVGARLYRNERIDVVSGGAYTIADAVVTFDSAGKTTVTLITATTTSHANNATVTLYTNSDLGSNPLRPASFPSEPTFGPVARLLYASATVETPSNFVRASVAAPVSLNAAAGFTIRKGFNATTSANWPTLALRNVTAGTTIQSVSTTDPAVPSTVHYTLQAAGTLTANTAVSLRVTSGTSGQAWQGIRWFSIWVGTSAILLPSESSGSNTLWHRAQSVIAGDGAGTRYTVTGVDLDHLLEGAAPLALGQSVRLRSDRLGINDTVKIVKLNYRFDQTEALNLELGTITPRLTGVTFDL